MQVDNIIVEMKFGSHLYGTDGPDSDIDIKGVFLPRVGDLLLGKRVKSVTNNTNDTNEKNTSSDIDMEFYSLHHFLKLALEGQTVALDMLHAPSTAIMKSSHLWDVLVEQRERFYTKNLKAFIGYARRQAAKYGIKGSRLADIRKVVKYLKSWSDAGEGDSRLGQIWNFLPRGEHINFLDNHVETHVPRMYQVAGKFFQETARIDYVLPILERFLESYGKRAQQAEQNEGVDWKAMSHAIRVAYQMEELLEFGTMTLPLPSAKLIRAIKQGEVNFKPVQAELEETMAKVEKLSEKSTLPEKADHQFAEFFIHYAYGYDENSDKVI